MLTNVASEGEESGDSGITFWSKSLFAVSRMIAGGSPGIPKIPKGMSESFPPKCVNDPQNVAERELQQQQVKLLDEINAHVENCSSTIKKDV
uniref:Mediator of RNA polymerase II transcription subunit 30 n=1 Tax=Elaeophora elaphi TaxID=1147741 RepID=A0A0R3RUW0_9BILA